MLNCVKLDTESIEYGRWFNLGKTQLKIAHTSNRKFKEALAKALTKGPLTVNSACKVLAKGILLDWAKLHHTDGSDVAYSEDMATYALITNIELREFVESTSSNLENFEEV